jgi:hypothetical protein
MMRNEIERKKGLIWTDREQVGLKEEDVRSDVDLIQVFIVRSVWAPKYFNHMRQILVIK